MNCAGRIRLAVVLMIFSLSPLLAQDGSDSVPQVTLDAAVRKMRKAYEGRDINKITKLFAKRTVDENGGEEEFGFLVGICKSAAPSVKATFGEPREIATVESHLFSVVPFRMEEKVSDTEMSFTSTCLVAVSDKGEKWEFHTCESIFSVFPELTGRFDVIPRTYGTEPIK